MRVRTLKSASILGAAAVAGLVSVGAAQAMPVGKLDLATAGVHKSVGVQKVIYRGGDSDLHAYPGGPGFLGKGAGGSYGHGHRHHR